MGERPPSPDFWFGWWYSGLGQQNTGSGDMHLGVREMKAPGTDFLDECQSGPHTFKPGQRSQCDVLHYWSYHPGGSVFSKCDGSVQFISYEQDNILPSLASRSDGLEAFSN